jgi:DNA-binding Lrp family transcriptional regulator
MIKIDMKDKRILYELDIDSRQSLSQIGKKVGLPKNVVAYRINKLKQHGIIKTFYTVVDAYKLGYIAFRMYLTYQYMTPEIEEQLIDYFIKDKLNWWTISAEGRFDLAVIVWVKDVNIFYQFWENTLKKFRDYIQDVNFSVYVQIYSYRHSYLLDHITRSERTKFELTGGGPPVNIDDLDFKILRIMAPNARIPLTDLANQLNSTVTKVNYRIKKLQKQGVIQGFRTDIDFSKLGYQFFKADIFLKDYDKRQEIIRSVRTNPAVIRIDQSVGVSDLELEFHVKSLQDFHSIMQDIINEFPDAIKNYKYVYASKLHKMNYMPEI